MALILYRPLFVIAALLFAALLLLLAVRRKLSWWPAWVTRAILAVLALVAIFSPGGELIENNPPAPYQIFLVDQSDSLDPKEKQSIREIAGGWQAAGDQRLLMVYGENSAPLLDSLMPWPEVDGRSSDLTEALSTAADLLGSQPGKIIIATDGLVDDPQSVDQLVRQVTQAGHTLEFILLKPRPAGNDGYTGPLLAPSQLWLGTPFDLVLPVYPPQQEAPVYLSLKINGQPVETVYEPLDEPYYRIAIQQDWLEEGVAALEVEASFGDELDALDPLPGNNKSYSVIRLFSSPRVLFLTFQQDSQPIQHLSALLLANGVHVNLLPPPDLPTSLKALQQYEVIILDSFLADQLSMDQMAALKVFVEELGGGLIFLGGRNSYTLGGYKNSYLEPLLPVRLEPPPRAEKPPVVFLLVIDRSASMDDKKVGNVRKIDLAREAAMRAIEIMETEDYLGVMTFSDYPIWSVSLGQLGDGLALRQSLDIVSRIKPVGGTRMYRALLEALRALEEFPIEEDVSRHILLLSDGRSSDGKPEEYIELAERALELNITISTIALDIVDNTFLQDLARITKGRAYITLTGADLPRIMVLESQAAQSDNIQFGRTSLRLGEEQHPVLSGLSSSQVPPLNAYNALSSRLDEGSEDILLSDSFNDPILSSWQYGLGRVVAWMGDLGEEWWESWATPQAEGAFWSQVIRYALPNPALGDLTSEVMITPTGMAVSTEILSAGKPVNYAYVTFSYAGDNGEIFSYKLSQTAPGIYAIDLPRPEPGAYRGVILVSTSNQDRQESLAHFSVPVPDEWLPPDESLGASQINAWALQAGTSLIQINALQVTEPEPEPVRQNTESWWWRILLALVVLWPVEIAIRRLWLPWT